MLIEGSQCNGCGTRVWADDPSVEEWTTAVETRPSDGKKTSRHLCPPCQDQRDSQLAYPEDRQQLTSGQHRVLDPSWVNPQLAQVLTPLPGDHDEDDRRAGVPLTAWDQPTGEPKQLPAAPPTTNGRRNRGTKAGTTKTGTVTQAVTSVLTLALVCLPFLGRWVR